MGGQLVGFRRGRGDELLLGATDNDVPKPSLSDDHRHVVATAAVRRLGDVDLLGFVGDQPQVDSVSETSDTVVHDDGDRDALAWTWTLAKTRRQLRVALEQVHLNIQRSHPHPHHHTLRRQKLRCCWSACVERFIVVHTTGLIDRVKVLRPTRHKIGHFGDVLPCQSLG